MVHCYMSRILIGKKRINRNVSIDIHINPADQFKYNSTVAEYITKRQL